MEYRVACYFCGLDPQHCVNKRKIVGKINKLEFEPSVLAEIRELCLHETTWNWCVDVFRNGLIRIHTNGSISLTYRDEISIALVEGLRARRESDRPVLFIKPCEKRLIGELLENGLIVETITSPHCVSYSFAERVSLDAYIKRYGRSIEKIPLFLQRAVSGYFRLSRTSMNGNNALAQALDQFSFPDQSWVDLPPNPPPGSKVKVAISIHE